ncbi:MAG: hypothetical protein K2L48_01730 [Mycoplasmoidaceae bacterium]|nr:hypothetical protein [Mycoplasmoidaceae bacterium]
MVVTNASNKEIKIFFQTNPFIKFQLSAIEFPNVGTNERTKIIIIGTTKNNKVMIIKGNVNKNLFDIFLLFIAI